MPDDDFDFAPTSGDKGHPNPAFEPPSPGAGPLDWFDRNRRGALLAGLAFQVAVLLGMIVVSARPRLDPGSRTVLLRVVPVDPRDLLRGDYVILSYDVSRPPNVQGLDAGMTVYVGLAPEEDGRHFIASGTVTPGPPPPGLFLKGTVASYGRVTYGIESYYVQEGRGHDYDEAARARKLSAEVAIAPDGRPGLLGLVIE